MTSSFFFNRDCKAEIWFLIFYLSFTEMLFCLAVSNVFLLCWIDAWASSKYRSSSFFFLPLFLGLLLRVESYSVSLCSDYWQTLFLNRVWFFYLFSGWYYWFIDLVFILIGLIWSIFYNWLPSFIFYFLTWEISSLFAGNSCEIGWLVAKYYSFCGPFLSAIPFF